MDFVEIDGKTTMEELISSNIRATQELSEGEITKGKVIEKRDNGVLVDIGFKSESFVSKDEFTNWQDVEIGLEIDVFVEKAETASGEPVVSYDKALHQKAWNKLMKSVDENSTVKGVITSKVKGGLIVTVDEIETFLPGSHIDIAPVKNINDMLDKEYEFRILKINKTKKNIILSRRKLLEEQRGKKKASILKSLEKGDVRKGVVKNILEFGAFIDLDGLDGLLHITDISWNRISHPSEVLSIGDKVEVMIIDINNEKQRVSLGMKQKAQDPWTNIETKYAVNDKIKTKVINIMPYGIFVQLEEGIEGLIHTSELSWTKKNVKATNLFQPGTEVEAIITNIEIEERKISLSYRQTKENPWKVIAEKYPIGTLVKGEVTRINNFSANIQIYDEIEGNLHISDMSWTRKVTHPNKMIKKGDIVEVKVLDIDKEEKRISVGLKQTQPDPWSKINQLKVGDLITGSVSQITNYGLFIALKSGIECLLHISEIDGNLSNLKKSFKLGQSIETKIIKIDSKEKEIHLSQKAVKDNTINDETKKRSSSIKISELLDDSLDKIKPDNKNSDKN